jgi:hypothetical protein
MLVEHHCNLTQVGQVVCWPLVHDVGNADLTDLVVVAAALEIT